jgi:hypothetical protein
MWLSGAYAVVAFACIAFALWPGVDAKGRFVFLQLPIALQGGLLQELGLAPYLEKLGWVEAYVLLALPTVALLYFIGRFFDKRH